jgi:hypothetical protein
MASSTGGSTVGTSTLSSNTGEISIRYVTFNGKQSDWESRKEKFLVKAHMRGYEDILDGTESVPNTHDDKGVKVTNLTADQQKIVDLNKKGFGDLILSIDCTSAAGKVAFAAVKGTKTKM